MYFKCASVFIHPPSLPPLLPPPVQYTDALTYISSKQQGSSDNVTIPFSHRALEAYSKVTYAQIVDEIKSMQKEYPGFLQVRMDGGREGGREGGVTY